jgi:hypothetical protein
MNYAKVNQPELCLGFWSLISLPHKELRMNGNEKQAKIWGIPRKVFYSFLTVCAILLVGWGAAYAVDRASASFTVNIDALTAGGGEASSTSFREVDAAVGQGAFFGEATSTNFREQSGVVQAWEVEDVHTAARHWRDYNQADK